MLEDLCEKYGVVMTSFRTRKELDKYRIKSTKWVLNEENVNKFNEIYSELLSMDLNQTIMTDGYSIAVNTRAFMNNLYSMNVYQSGAGVSVLAIWHSRAIKLSIGSKSRQKMNGYTAYIKFVKVCEKYGIDLGKYALGKEDAMAVKQTIESPLIKLSHFGETITDAHHIDFHSSWPAGVCNRYPEFRPMYEDLFGKRHLEPENKDIMNKSLGYCQCSRINYKYALLAAAGINDNNARVRELAKRIEESGREILGYNTDGIWYRGDKYHGAGEGSALGEWENDHNPMMFRAWSDGAYEYTDDNDMSKVHPVLRGLCSYDSVNPDRDSWAWGDIHYRSGKTFGYYWDDEIGFIKEVE